MGSQIDIQLSEQDLNDQGSIVKIINTWMSADVNSREERVKSWSEALNFFAGNQWITYNTKAHRFEPIPVTDANKIIDRPVTNHILRWVTAHVSRFTNKHTIIVDPNSDDMSDKTAAKISEVILDYLYEDLDKDAQYLEAALWGTICGTVFRKSFKKYTNKFLDVGGDDKSQIKCVDADIISPFQIVFDGLPQRWRDIGTIMHAQVRRIDDIKRQFTIDAPGYFPEAAQDIEEEDLVDTSLTFSEGLKGIVDGNGSYSGAASHSGSLKDSAIYKEVYVKPSQKYPKGLMICAASNQLLYFGESPAYFLDGKIWHPFTSWNWGTMPGSIWGISLVNQLIKNQKRLNQIDALMAYNRKTMAIPGWWVPSGCGVPEGSMIGIPGLVKTYDETPGGGKPTANQAMPLSNQVLEERNIIIQEGDRLALAGDIRSGENPSGVTTLGALQILNEEAQKSQSKQIESWEKFIERSETLDLLTFKDVYQAPDPDMVKNFKRFSKDITDQEWQVFTGSYLRDNATIRVERGSTIAKSRVIRQNMLLKLAGMGFFPEMFSDPYQYKKFLEEFGMMEMYKDANIDVKFAEKSIEMMLAGNYPPVLPEVHNPDIQLPIIMRFMKDPKYLEIDPKIQVLFDKRRKELVAALVAAGPVSPPAEDVNPPKRGPMGGSGAMQKEPLQESLA